MRQNDLLTSPLLCLVALLLCSCNHKELVYPNDEGATRVVFDWSQVNAPSPDGMLLVSFSSAPLPVSFSFDDPTGGTIYLPVGERKFIAHNDNTEDLHARGTTWKTYEIYALPSVISMVSPMFATTRQIPMAPGTELQDVIFEPNELWTSAVDNVRLGYGTVIMPMESATREMEIVIQGVENLENVREIAGTISGMSGSYFPATQTFSAAQCVIPFTMSASGQSTIRGRVRIFSHVGSTDDVSSSPQLAATHHLVLYLMLDDYSKYYTSFDVSDAVNDAIATGGANESEPLKIVIPKFTIPEPLTNGTGLHPTVDTWEEIDINIKM